MCVSLKSLQSDSATLWTVACQAPLSMGFSRQEYCSGLPCPPPGNLPDPGIKPASFMSPEVAGGFFTTSTTEVIVSYNNSGLDLKRLSTNFDYNDYWFCFIVIIRLTDYCDTIFGRLSQVK